MALGASRSASMSSGLLLVRVPRETTMFPVPDPTRLTPVFSSFSSMAAPAATQDPLPSPTAEPVQNGATRFRPYASPDHHVTKARYITSNDPRGYMYAYFLCIGGCAEVANVDLYQSRLRISAKWPVDNAGHGRRVRALDGHLERCASLRLGLAAVALTPRRFARTAALGNSKGALAAAYAFIVQSAVLTPTDS